MIPLKPDLTISEVKNSSSRWCKSGHPVPSDIRMFTVSGDTLVKERWGDYCEACLKTANQMVAKNVHLA